MPKKIRADEILVERGSARDLKEAGALIMAGRAMVTDPEGHEEKVGKAGELVDASSTVRILGGEKSYVSRGGGKLEAALEAFSISVAGKIAADIGLSTGGFTDCLLSRDALRVHGVDVAHGIVDWSLRQDPRLVLHERTNARKLGPNAFGELVHIAVIDVSFISLIRVLEPIAAQLVPEGEIVALIKPQFELPKEEVEGGVVTDPAKRQSAFERVVSFAELIGFELRGRIDSPIPGAEGNVEILVHLVRRRVP